MKNRRKYLHYILFEQPWAIILLLCVSTYLSFITDLRYSVIEPDILQGKGLSLAGPGPSIASKGVEVAGDDGLPTIWLSDMSRGGDAAVARRLTVPDADALRPVVELRAIDMLPGSEAWQVGRIEIRSYDRGGKFNRYWPKIITSVSGNLNWREFTDVIPLPEAPGRVYFVAYNAAVSGVMGLRNVRIAGLEERPAFGLVKYALIFLWGVVAVILGWVLVWERKRHVSTYCFLFLAMIALAGILAPQPYFGQLMKPVEEAARSMASITSTAGADHYEVITKRRDSPTAGPESSPPEPDGSRREVGVDSSYQAPYVSPGRAFHGVTLKQAGHFAVFFLLAVFASFVFRPAPVRTIVWYLGIFAISTETLQYFLITRSSQSLDVVVDIVAVAAGCGISALAWRLIGRGRAIASDHVPR
jgi:hypothetical protein